MNEALRLSGLKRREPIHKKELLFSVHYDEPGHAEDILMRKVKVIFFGKHPDLSNPNVVRAIDEADYFCAQTYHFQQRKIEDNELAKNTGGQMRRMFGRLGKLIVDGGVLATGGVGAAAAAAKSAASSPVPSPGASESSAAQSSKSSKQKKTRVKREAEVELDADLVEGGEEEEDLPVSKRKPRVEDVIVPGGKRRAAAQAEQAIKATFAKEEVIDVDGDVVMDDVVEQEGVQVDDDVAMTDNVPQEEEVEEEEYEVEDILDDRVVQGRRQFLVRWKGYDESFDTWQDTDDCGNCPDIIKAYVTRRYHSHPDKLLSMLSSFKRAKPVGVPAASATGGVPNLLNLPADVRFFHDVKNNMIVLMGTNASKAAAQVGQGHEWRIASVAPVDRREGGEGKHKRPKPHALADSAFDGVDVMGLWKGVQPPWVSKVSAARQLGTPAVREVLTELRNRDQRNLLGCWSRDHAFRTGEKVWYNVLGWSILERSAGAVEVLTQMHPACHLDPCCGDINDHWGVTKVDAMFLAAWHGRVEIVEVLLRHGATPFSVSNWSGFDKVIPLEICLVFYYLHHGGLVNEHGAKADTPQAILAAMKDSICRYPSLLRNPLYVPTISPEDASPQSKVLAMFQNWIRSQPDASATELVAGNQPAAVKQTARRNGRLGQGAVARGGAGGGGDGVRTASSSPAGPPPNQRGTSVDPLVKQESARPQSPERPASTIEAHGMDPMLAEAINKIQLGAFVKFLADNGVRTIFDLRRLTDADMKDLGLKPFHITKLSNLAATLIIEHNKRK